jgi:DeoR/GlpR family transcriptional regulator of sugar metabolism
LDLVRRNGFVSLPALTSELQVSATTIRRDLDYLEAAGETKRTHGGVFYTGPTPKLPHFERRQRSQWDKKRDIAVRAAQLIEEGDTILLDGGSTTYELARQLVNRNVQVVTNSLPVATLLMSGANNDLVLIGGYVHQRTGVCLGPYANEMLGRLNVRRAFVSVAAINERGCYNSNLLLVETEKAMMKSSEELIVLADSTKFGHQSLAHMCELTEIGRLVVDGDVTEAWRNTLKSAHVELLIADRVEAEETPGARE